MKVERGLAAGDVMYHATIKKTPEEAKRLKAKATEKDALKRQRREEQVRRGKEQSDELRRHLYVIPTSNFIKNSSLTTRFALHRKRMSKGKTLRRRRRERRSFRGGKKGKRRA